MLVHNDATRSIRTPHQHQLVDPSSKTKHFKYVPLLNDSRNESSPDFRLLELLPGPSHSIIRTRLTNAKLSDRKNGFAALSYEWGSATSFSKTIHINGESFMIRQNLWRFLSQIRHQMAHRLPMMLWVDSVCINQLDLKEKSHQVRIMHKIYAHAYEVLVWLGEADDLSPQVFRLLHRYVDEVEANGAFMYMGLGRKRPYLGRTGIVLDVMNNTANHEKKKQALPSEIFGGNEEIREALLRLCRRTYWTRAWIIQECLNARNVSLFCGSEHLPHDAFPLLGELCWQLVRKDYPLSRSANAPSIIPKQQSSNFTFHKSNDPISRVIELTRRWYIDRHDGLESLLQSYHGSKCSNSYDKVYAFLGLSQDGDQFPVDYTISLHELLVQTIFFCNNSRRKVKPNETDPIKMTCDSIHVAQLVTKDLELAGDSSTMHRLQQCISTLPDTLLSHLVTIELDYLGQLRFPTSSSELDGVAAYHNRCRFKVNKQTYEATTFCSGTYGDRVFALRGIPLVLVYRRTILHLKFIGLATLSTSQPFHELSQLLSRTSSQVEDDGDTYIDHVVHQVTYHPIRYLHFPSPGPVPRYYVQYGQSYASQFFRRFILPILPVHFTRLLMTQNPDSAYYASPFIRLPLKYVLDIIVLWSERKRGYEEYCEDLESEREVNKMSVGIKVLRSAVDIVLRIKNSIMKRWSQSTRR